MFGLHIIDLQTAFRAKLKELMLDENLMEDLDRIYLPMANLIHTGLNVEDKTQIIGVNGAQGAGKTTFSALLKVVLEIQYNMKVVSFSIDDFYLTRAEREKLAQEVHPLLITRGVPGTHNVHLWQRAVVESNVILFDGWFMGAVEQKETELLTPINDLERNEDPYCVWRRYVNSQLKDNYKSLFDKIDILVMLKVPSFDKVYEWRTLQENKLRMKTEGQKNLRVMSDDELKRFISHYERLTRFMLKEMPSRADMLFNVSADHRICI